MNSIKVKDTSGNVFYVLDPGPGPLHTETHMDGSTASFRKLGESPVTDDGRYVSKSREGTYSITETGEILTRI